MAAALTERLAEATRQELARSLAGLCLDVGAAESSILLPGGGIDLVFFASTNPALMQPDTPRVPINASFSGIAFRTGQTIAVADAAGQAAHFDAVDALVKSRTREFAAIPIAEHSVLGVLTLVNRAAPVAGESRPFDIAELRQGEALARELAHAFALLPGLAGIALHEADHAQALDKDFVSDLASLNEAERRVVHSLVGALLRNRAD